MPGDLHVHSTASDGTLTPAQLVQKALESGLTTISLTDHDTTGGIRPALKAASGTSLEVIPGIELNTDWDDTEVHILGYYLDPHSPLLQQYLNRLRQAREDRVQRMLQKLANLGIKLSFRRVQEIAGEGSLGRPHIARAMLEAGYITSISEAFGSYLGRGQPAYVPRRSLTPFRAITLIQKVGGIPVLAHPGLMERDELIPSFIDIGLKGIEVYYPEHTPEMTEKYETICQAAGLIKTGGTDYHGPGQDYPPLGTVTVGEADIIELKRAYRQLRQESSKKQEF